MNSTCGAVLRGISLPDVRVKFSAGVTTCGVVLCGTFFPEVEDIFFWGSTLLVVWFFVGFPLPKVSVRFSGGKNSPCVVVLVGFLSQRSG